MRRLGLAAAALAALIVLAALSGCGGVVKPKATPAPAPKRVAGAAVVSEKAAGPRLLDLTVRSPALGGDEAHVRLLTPDGWRKGSSRRWPVLYLLHGCCDDYRSWTRSTDVARIAALRRVLVVMPDGGDIGFYSDWPNGGPGWETFHARELPALLARYGAGDRRVVAGLSMGGLGAMDYAAREPGLFRAAASFSGVLHPLADASFWTGLFAQYASSDAVWGDPQADRGAWKAHDPASLALQLRGTPLFVASGDGADGDGTERVVGRESRQFVARVHAVGGHVQTDLYRGGKHDWPFWQRDLHRALPLLLGALRR